MKVLVIDLERIPKEAGAEDRKRLEEIKQDKPIRGDVVPLPEKKCRARRCT